MYKEKFVTETLSLPKADNMSESNYDMEKMADLIKSGQGEIHTLYSEGKTSSQRYQELSFILIKSENGQNIWKDISEIDIEKLEDTISKSETILNNETEDMGTEQESIDYYLKKSKITDSEKALDSLMRYAGASTEEDMINKLKEMDIVMFTPDNLPYLDDPDIDLLKSIRDVGSAFGYTFINTPSYELSVRNLIDEFRKKKGEEKSAEVEDVFKELITNFENEKEKSQFEKIDNSLFEILEDKEELKKYIETQKKLPPDAEVYLYHGLNSGNYEDALEILNSDVKGIEQRSGPTLSIIPIGQFWKGVGFRYALRRDQIKFSGDINSEAVVEMIPGDDGIEDVGYIIDKSGSLPFDKFKANIMRSKFTLPNPEIEEILSNKLKGFVDTTNHQNETFSKEEMGEK